MLKTTRATLARQPLKSHFDNFYLLINFNFGYNYIISLYKNRFMDGLAFLENFQGILDDTDLSAVKLDTTFRELGEWSSLTALTLIAMVDEEYSVKLTGDDIKSSNTVEDLFNIIKQKI